MTEKSLKIARFGSFSFDLHSRELLCSGSRIPLRPKAAQLLHILLEAEGQTVSHVDIYAEIWPDRVVSQLEGLHQLAKDVRRALNHDPDESVTIENLPRVGYRLVGIITTAEEQPTLPKPDAKSAYLKGLLTLPALILGYCLILGLGALA